MPDARDPGILRRGDLLAGAEKPPARHEADFVQTGESRAVN